jgi:mannose-6-phosphate isomerase-like protein (cupin superfamily)
VKSDALGARKVSAATAEHYSWGGDCDGWHLVRRRELSVIRERMPPGAAELRHLHTASRQFFFVLSGSAVLEVAGTEIELTAGEGVEVAPGTPHQLLNRSALELEFLVVSQPHSHGDRTLVPS